jgi:RimJ/RimL family protein N-acetyltransferase
MRAKGMIQSIQKLNMTSRLTSLKSKTMSYPRSMSVEQARIITRVYQENEKLPIPIKRATALAHSLVEMPIAIDPEELIVGNRTPEIRAGVVFPEAGISWIANELDTLSQRPQDPFHVHDSSKAIFLDEIEPYWRGRTMEDHIYGSHGKELKAIEKVVKINQKDHAQGHICPHVEEWLGSGPAGLLRLSIEKLEKAPDHQKEGYGKQALQALINHGFLDWGFNRIWGEVFDGNPAMKIFEGLGFQADGICREAYFRNGGFCDSHIISVLSKDVMGKRT